VGIAAAGAALAALVPGFVAAQTALEPIDPTVGEQALIDAAASVPIRDIDAALKRFPVPYVITARAGSGSAVTVSNRAGQPTRLNVDGNKKTGQGGHDVEVLLTTQTDPAGITLRTTRLGSASFIQDVRLTVAFPFESFTSETLPGRPNLFLGLRTARADAAVGGVLPAVQTLQLVPTNLAGTSHVFDLDVATTGPDNPQWLFAGHFGGDKTTGTLNVAGFATYVEPMPASLDLTLDVDESDPAGSDPFGSAATLRWAASEVTRTAMAYVEHETAPDTTPDFRTLLSVPDLPEDATVSLSADEDAGTWSVTSDGSDPSTRLIARRHRDDGFTMTADIAAVPEELEVGGALAGSAAVVASDSGADVDVVIQRAGGFDGTDGLFGRDVGRLDVALTDAVDLEMAHSAGDDGPQFNLATGEDAGPVPAAVFLVGDATPPLLPDDWDDREHGYSLIDRADIDEDPAATTAARVVNASAVEFTTASADVEQTLTLATAQPAALGTSIDADAGSAFAPVDDDVDVACDVADISPDTATFATNFSSTFSYDSDPAAALDAIDCAGSIGSLDFDFAMAGIPGPFSFGFDPDGSVDLLLAAAEVAAAAADPPRIGLLSMRLSDAAGLPGSGDLFEEPIADARLRLDDTPSMTADWTDDGETAVDAATVDDEQVLVGVQVAVSTEVELATPFAAPGNDDELTIDVDSADDSAIKRLQFGLFGVDDLALVHDGATGYTDVDGLTAGGRSLAFDLATAYDDMGLAATCTVDPLPDGRLELTTDYAGTYGYTTTPAAPLEQVVCTGTTGVVDFEVALDDLPPALEVTLDPQSGIAVVPTDPDDDDPVIGGVRLTISHPTGFPGTGALLGGKALQELAFAITDVPGLAGGWGRQDGELTASIDAVGEAVIGGLQMSLADKLGTADFDAVVTDPTVVLNDNAATMAQLSSPTSPALMQSLPGPARSVLAAVLGLRNINITWNPTTQLLTLFFDSAAPQVLTLNVNTTVPLVNFPFQLTCTFDQLPADQTTVTTNLAGRWIVNTQPRQPIDTLGCTGKANTGNFETTFSELPGFMDFSFFLDAVQATLRGADDDTGATLGRARMRLFADEGSFLPASAGLLGEPLAEVTLQLDDTPDVEGFWSFGDTDLGVAVRGTQPVVGEEPESAALEGFQLAASTALDGGGEAIDPTTATQHSLLVQRTAPEPDAPRRAELRLFDFSTGVFTKTTVEEEEDDEEDDDAPEPAEGEEPDEPATQIDGLIEATEARRLEVALLGSFPGTTAAERFELDAQLVVEKVPASMEFSSDFTEIVRYTASDPIEFITLDATVQKTAPVEEADENQTRITAALEGLPAVLRANVNIADKTASVRSFGGADRLHAEITGAGGIMGTEYQWLEVEVVDLPSSMSVSFSDTPEQLRVRANGWATFRPGIGPRAAVGSVELSVSRVSSASALLDRLHFIQPEDNLIDNGGCFVDRTAWGEAIDARAWALSVQDRLEELHCDTFRLEAGDSRVLARFDTETVEGQDVEQLTWATVRIPGIRRVAVTINKPPAPPPVVDPENPPPGPLDFPQRVIVETAAEGNPPLFVGVHYPDAKWDEVVFARVGSVPESMDLEFDPEGLLDFDTSSSLGAIDVYAGPRRGARTLREALRLHIPSAPEDLTLDIRDMKKMSLLEDPLQPALWSPPEASFQASSPFEVRLLLQGFFEVPTDDGSFTAGGRVRAVLELEDLDLRFEVLGPGYSPCDEVAGFDTCLGLLAVREHLDLTGSDSDEGLRGFVLVDPLMAPDVPVALDDGTPAGRFEHAPLLGVMLDDFDGGTIGLELQLDPKVPAGVYPFVDLELVSFDLVGGYQLTFWDPGFTLQWPLANDDGEPVTCTHPGVACITKPPSYVDNTPWTWLPTFPGYIPQDPFS
jgi:hypothetical protein